MQMVVAPLLFVFRRSFTPEMVHPELQMPITLFTQALPDELPHRLHVEPGTLVVG